MGIFSKFISKIKGVSTADPLDWQELEAELLAADLGPALTSAIIKDAKSIKGDDALAALTQILNSKLSSKSRTLNKVASTSALLVVGVNGTGKTTSVAKLASSLKGSGSSVILAAADTFRAAAVEQLQTWGARIGVEVIAGKDGAEPASVVFDAAARAGEQGALLEAADLLDVRAQVGEELDRHGAPVGAFGAMAFTIGKYGVDSLFSLGKLMGAFYVTCLIFVFGVLGIISRLHGFSVWRFVCAVFIFPFGGCFEKS